MVIIKNDRNDAEEGLKTSIKRFQSVNTGLTVKADMSSDDAMRLSAFYETKAERAKEIAESIKIVKMFDLLIKIYTVIK